MNNNKPFDKTNPSSKEALTEERQIEEKTNVEIIKKHAGEFGESELDVIPFIKPLDKMLNEARASERHRLSTLLTKAFTENSQKIIGNVEQMQKDIKSYFEEIDQPTHYNELMDSEAHLQIGFSNISKEANRTITLLQAFLKEILDGKTEEND